MTLKDLYSKPLSQILEQLDMIDLKVHSDSNGVMYSIESRYADPSCSENIIKKR